MMGKTLDPRRSGERTHFHRTFVTAAFIMPAARSHSLRTTAWPSQTCLDQLPPVKAARMRDMPCTSTSSTISCSTRFPLARLNDGGSHGAEGHGVRHLQGRRRRRRTQVDTDDWLGGAGRGGSEAIAIASTRLRTARIVHTFSCRILGMDVFRRILML